MTRPKWSGLCMPEPPDPSWRRRRLPTWSPRPRVWADTQPVVRTETEQVAQETRCDDERVSTNGPSIRDQVWHAVDPTGENRALINAAIHGSRDVPDFLRRVGVDVGESWGHLAVSNAEYRRSIEGIAAAVGVLGPRGWAVMTMDTEVVRRAVQAAEVGRGDEADDLLADPVGGRRGVALDADLRPRRSHGRH